MKRQKINTSMKSVTFSKLSAAVASNLVFIFGPEER